jgi:serine/threonine protein kinase
MSERIWERLKGKEVAPNVQLGELLFSDSRHAVFRAEYTGRAEEARDVLIQLFLEERKDSGERVNRFLEAKFFQNPHLLRYLEAGTFQRNERTVTYAITEGGDVWGSRSLAPQEALSFARDILSGLEYLHEKDLVYCLLSPRSVVAVGSDWKLSDFSELRVSGEDASAETLALASSLDTSPPEAVEGKVTAAWDIWAFGQTVQKVLARKKAELPNPFRAVFLACVNINPSLRPTASQLLRLLEPTRPSGRESEMWSAARA